MAIDAGSVVVADDGTETKSGLAEAIYDVFVGNHEADTGVPLVGPMSVMVAIKRNYATLATRFAQGQVTYYNDSFLTAEQGLAVTMINKTGVASVKGSVLQASAAADDSFALQTTQLESIGICYDNGIPDGSECRVIVCGKADVLLADGAGANSGDWLAASAVNGRAYSTGVVPPPVHFYEIGHALQTVAGGVSVLCRAAIHFL